VTASSRLANANTARQRRDRMALAQSGWTPEEIATTLSDEETEQLASCEQVIGNGIKIWHQVGEALLHIRDNRLYRESYTTFEAYCRERWQMAKTSANRLISGFEVVANLTPIGVIPANESQARELAPFTPEEQRMLVEVVREVIGDHPTAADYKSLGAVLREIKTTGAIDDGTGEQIPLSQATPTHIKAAVTEETYERMARQSVHIASKKPAKVYSGIVTLNRPDRTTLVLTDCPALPDELGTRYRMVLYEIKD